MQIKKNEEKRDLTFLIIFGVVFMVYAICLNWSFTGDQVNTWNLNGGKAAIPNATSVVAFFSAGRFAAVITESLRWLLSLFGITLFQHQLALKLSIVFAASYITYYLYKLFLPFFNFLYKEKVILLCLIFAVANPYFVELYTYSGFEWAIALFLIVFSLKAFFTRKYILSSIILFFIISIYQSYVEIFLIIAISFIYIQYSGKIEKKLISEYIKVFLVATIPAALNIFSMKFFIIGYNLLEKTKVNQGAANITEVKKVSITAGLFERVYSVCIVYYESVCTCFGMFPKGMLLAILCVIILCTLSVMIYQHMSKTDIFFYLVTNLMIQLFSVAIYFVAVGTGATAGRIVWIVFLSIGMTALISLFHLQNTKIQKIFTVLMTLFLFIDIYSTETAAMDFYIANKLDMQEAIQIQAHIDEYEKKTGNQIQKIAVRYLDGYEQRDCNPLLSRKYLMGTYHNTTFHKSWANVELINYITKEHYEKEEMPDSIYQSYFAGKKWITFMPDEQTVFQGDTMYWAIY